MSRAFQAKNSPKGCLGHIDIERLERVADGLHLDDKVMQVASRELRSVRKISSFEKCIDQSSAFSCYITVLG